MNTKQRQSLAKDFIRTQRGYCFTARQFSDKMFEQYGIRLYRDEFIDALETLVKTEEAEHSGKTLDHEQKYLIR